MFNGLLAIVGFPIEWIMGNGYRRGFWERSSRFLDIWVLFEFGVKESWTKIFHISLSLSSDCPERPLGFWRNRQLFMQNVEGQLVLYDLQTHSKKIVLQIPGDKIEPKYNFLMNIWISECYRLFPIKCFRNFQTWITWI
jgi:hypothetical protein